MTGAFPTLLILIFAYLLGSISSGIMASKLMRLQDPRSAGSGNVGATNVLRVSGKRAGAITLIGDILKGFIPVMLAKAIGFSELIIALVALTAFLGHLYPIYYHFKGGKGVATGLGILLAFNPLLGAVIFAIWLFILALFRYSSLAAISAVSLGLIYTWRLLPGDYYVIYIIVTLFILWRHRDNILRLLKGCETKVGQR